MRVYATLLLVCVLLQIPWWKPRRVERILFSSPPANKIEMKKKKKKQMTASAFYEEDLLQRVSTYQGA